jgi:hypothetical protein
LICTVTLPIANLTIPTFYFFDTSCSKPYHP